MARNRDIIHDVQYFPFYQSPPSKTGNDKKDAYEMKLYTKSLNRHFSSPKSGGYDPIIYFSRKEAIEEGTGIFNQNGYISDEDKMRIRFEVRNSKCTVKMGVISFTDELAELCVSDTSEAQKFMKYIMPKYIKAMGMAISNTEWFAALHCNTDAMHVHYYMWEKLPINSSRIKYKNEAGETKYKAVKTFSKGKVSADVLDQMDDTMKFYAYEHASQESLYKNRDDFIAHVKKKSKELSIRVTVLKMEKFLSKDHKYTYASLDKADKEIVKHYVDIVLGPEKVNQLENYKLDIFKFEQSKSKFISQNNTFIKSIDRIENIYSRLGNILLKVFKQKNDLDNVHKKASEKYGQGQIDLIISTNEKSIKNYRNEMDIKGIDYEKAKFNKKTQKYLNYNFKVQLNEFYKCFTTFLATLLVAPEEPKVKHWKKDDEEEREQ